jgi:ribosomal protein S18 acetylase RimI-like enzyme
VRIVRLGADDAAEIRGELTDVYRGAWSNTGFFPVEEELRGFSERLHRHASNPDFRLCVKWSRTSPVGFAYGYTSVPGGWWRQMVTTGLPEEVADRWFEDCFEFAELAVMPGSQSRGVGSALHDSLLEDLPHHSSVLSTQRANEKALNFYKRRDWAVIEENFFFPNRIYPYSILGLDLSRERGT